METEIWTHEEVRIVIWFLWSKHVPNPPPLRNLQPVDRGVCGMMCAGDFENGPILWRLKIVEDGSHRQLTVGRF